MVEKVKVNYEVAEALRRLFASNKKDYSNDEILRLHYRAKHEGELWSGEWWSHLNVLTLSQMSQALFIGYEIEETPEEKILATYQRQRAWQETNDPYDRRAHTAYGNAIVFTLDTLGIEIEGINK